MALSVIVGWVFGVDRAKKEIARGAELRVPRIVWFVIKYISPLYLLAIFAGWCYQKFPAKIDEILALETDDRGVVLLILSFIILLLVFFGLLVHLAGRRWADRGGPLTASVGASDNMLQAHEEDRL